MFFVPLNKFKIKFCPYADLGANTIVCVKRSCLSPFRTRAQSPEDFCFFVFAEETAPPRASSIGHVEQNLYKNYYFSVTRTSSDVLIVVNVRIPPGACSLQVPKLQTAARK